MTEVNLSQYNKDKRKLVTFIIRMVFSDGSLVKYPPANAEFMGSIPGSERSPGEGNGYPLQYSSWRIPWTEEPGRLQTMGSQRVGHD